MNNSIIYNVYKKALIPNIILVLGGTINVFFDGILVGQRLGSLGLDSVNQCLPFYLILCTIGSLISSGSFSLSSIAIGKNDLKEARRLYRVGLFLCLCSGFVVCLLAFLFSNKLALLFSNSQTYQYVKEYLRITILGGLINILQYQFTFYLRLEGKAKYSSYAYITMTITNIILNYLFLFVFDFQIKGAAIASVIASFVACLMSFIFLYTNNSNYALGPAMAKKTDIAPIILQGSSMAINNISSSLRIFMFNQIFKMMSLPSMVSIFAILSNLNEFSICIQTGVPSTGSAIMGVLFGGKEYKCIQGLLYKELRLGVILSITFGLLLSLFSGYIPSLFGVYLNCRYPIILFSISLVFACVNTIMTYYYNSILKIKISDMITVLRVLVIPVTLGLIFMNIPSLFWFVYPFSEIIVVMIIAFRKNLLMIDLKEEENAKIYQINLKANEQEIIEASKNANEFCEKNELSPKKAMALSLAIEEILIIIAQKSLKMNGEIDLRVYKNNDDVIIRIRSLGDNYNPFKQNDESLDYLGVKMIEKIAKKIDYQTSLGLNTLIIAI